MRSSISKLGIPQKFKPDRLQRRNGQRKPIPECSGKMDIDLHSISPQHSPKIRGSHAQSRPERRDDRGVHQPGGPTEALSLAQQQPIPLCRLAPISVAGPTRGSHFKPLGTEPSFCRHRSNQQCGQNCHLFWMDQTVRCGSPR